MTYTRAAEANKADQKDLKPRIGINASNHRRRFLDSDCRRHVEQCCTVVNQKNRSECLMCDKYEVSSTLDWSMQSLL